MGVCFQFFASRPRTSGADGTSLTSHALYRRLTFCGVVRPHGGQRSAWPGIHAPHRRLDTAFWAQFRWCACSGAVSAGPVLLRVLWRSGCCQAVPCARRGALPITFQKTHDFELNVPRDVPEALYVILHRVPVPAVLSAREMYADDYGEEVAADRGEYAVWLGRNAEYYVRSRSAGSRAPATQRADRLRRPGARSGRQFARCSRRSGSELTIKRSTRRWRRRCRTAGFSASGRTCRARSRRSRYPRS